MTAKFKPGDVVVRTGGDTFRYSPTHAPMILGNKYVVSSSTRFSIQLEGCGDDIFDPDFFELVEDETNKKRVEEAKKLLVSEGYEVIEHPPITPGEMYEMVTRWFNRYYEYLELPPPERDRRILDAILSKLQ